MLKDITLGQYFPGNSFIHKMDPRMKIISSVLYIIILFVASRPLGLVLGVVLAAMMYFVITYPAGKAIEALERRMRRGDKH